VLTSTLHSFDLPSYVLRAFAGLEVTVDLVSAVKIGEYTTSLTYSQPNVPAYTDSTLTVRLSLLCHSRGGPELTSSPRRNSSSCRFSLGPSSRRSSTRRR